MTSEKATTLPSGDESGTEATEMDAAPSGLTVPVANPEATLTGEAKRQYVSGMFSRIAGRYDLMNYLMTFGQDGNWRRFVVKVAQPRAGGLALDVATGTGRIAQSLAQEGSTAVGIDLTPDMMFQGRRDGVGSTEPVYFAGADALKLPFKDNTFDCVTTGFAMRNVVDIEAAFREMYRVVKPGGRVVCLEVGKPRSSITRFGHSLHTRFVVPLLGRLIAGDPDAYSYLPSSMRRFPPPHELALIMRRAGLKNVRYRQFTMGAAAVHYGDK
jgi:demethylmenaquinone methyltransferase/2-methoxy-6-polyprenyl-1,4-benzoquinol methylase